MIRQDYKNYREKFGVITGGPRMVPAGISSKTGKNFETFAYFKMLEVNAEDTESVYISLDELPKFETVTADMHWIGGINVTGYEDEKKHFVAVDIAPFNLDELSN